MAKTQIKNYVFKPGIGANDNRFPDAYGLLSANKAFIQKEATAWIQDQIDANTVGFIGYTYNQAKCERDVGYVIDAYLSDLRYGGNENLRNTIKYYWDQDVAQVDGDRQPEIQTHTFIGDLIENYIFTKTLYSASNTDVTQTVSGNVAETTAQFTPTGATYIPSTGNMTLTVGAHSLTVGDEIFVAPGGITFTCGLDNNATLHPYPRASGVPNDSGRDPYYYVPITITSTTSTTITVNVGISSDTSTHTFVSAIANSVTSGPAAKINTSVFNTVDVITNGLIAEPKLVPTGVGTIKIQGRYGIDDILLITNSTRSEVVYNFTNSATGASLTIQERGADADFTKYLQTTDAVTTIKLNYNTVTHLSTDDIQIFIEEKEVRTRPYDFGTDAIERMRIAPPVSMLDADFEYGLQPTKWSAIGTMRGYPSVYEIPGTDASVLRVVTDASLSEPVQTFTAQVTNSGTAAYVWSSATDRLGGVSGNNPTITLFEGDTISVTNNATNAHPFYFKTIAGTGTANQVSNVTNNGGNTGGVITWVTQPGDAGIYYYQCSAHTGMVGIVEVLPNDNGNGVGQSLITVTTVGAHGFASGTPVSIKALENSIAGASRAEGTFIIVNVPSPSTFQYFAKAKVGTLAGQILSTGYTQLREAGFYTGASIGTPNFIISSNGSSGTMFTQLGVLAGETIIPFDGQSPELGSPLSQANIPLGSQVTGIIDNSAGGGTYITPLTNSNTLADQNQMVFQNIIGVVENLAIDRGDGYGIHIIDITGNTATFNDNFVAEIPGNKNQYLGITPSNDVPAGELAQFDISYANDSSFTYVIDAIANDGIKYEIGDSIKILGTDLGGTSPANDATVIVTEVGSSNSIATADILGNHFNNDIYLTNQSATFTGGVGSGAAFNIDFLDGVYTNVTVGTGFEGADYKVGDVLTISGSVFAPSVVGTIFDLYISVNSVSSLAGQVTNVNLLTSGATYTNQTGATTTGGTGSGLTVDTTTSTGAVTNVVINNPGLGYSELDVITISGGDGAATFRVLTVSSIGAITGISFAGTAPQLEKQYTSVAYTSTTASGSGAVIDVTITGASYQVTFTNQGINYLPTETITVLGTALGGVSPANDLTITIDNVGGTGNIVATSEAGVTYNGDSLTEFPANNRTPSGATFNISQNTDGGYVASLDSPGTLYNTGMELVVSGSLFGGTSPANDLTITVDTVSNIQTGTILTISSIGVGYIPVGTYTNIGGDTNPAIGSGAEFSLIRENSNYSNIETTSPGLDYQVGNRLLIAAAQVDGVSPLNDILLRVISVDISGGVTGVVPEYIEASAGASADLIATVTMSEPTNGIIPFSSPITFSAIATIEVSFESAHGLVPGDTFITSVSSDDGVNNHNLVAGSYIATEIPTVSTLRFQARTIGSIDALTADINGSVYPKPDSFFIHRPFDGGVQLGTGGPQHGAQAIRQSKKYIRYQSGKGIMYTTGALFAPSYDLRSVTADGVEVGSEITIVTDDNDHGLQIGGIIRLLGIETPGYNSGNETAVPPIFDYEVLEIVDERTFKVLSRRRLGDTTAVLGFAAQMSVVSWHGATVRSGIFDDQNGIFWEYDGTQISVVQRTGTYQIAGTVAIETDKNLLTGTNTRFRDQLKAGDRIIIRGMTHVVSHVNGQDELTVTPDWRGVTSITGAKAMLIFDKKTKQEDFNLDRLDGTGPSGYDIDIAKMQMIGIQYSWYGAGFIDFMLRGSNGNFVFAHRMRNSNVNTEAFMRSGNLPVRYEVTNEGPNGRLLASIDSTATTIPLVDGSFFPPSGTLYIDNEIIEYTGRTGNNLTGAVRGATFTNFQSGAQRSYTAAAATTHDSGTGVILISQTITPLISHWGSAFITDGGFDEDRGYIFSYAETGVTISTTKQTAFMIRLAPSVSNAIVGDLGERELLNRAQLLLQGIELTSDTGTGGIVVEGVLNPQNFPLDPGSVSWSGLAGVAQGGQPSFAQVAAGGSVVWSTGEAATTATATAQANLTSTATIRYNSGNNQRYFYAARDSWEASGAVVGDFVTLSNSATWGVGLQITSVEGPYSSGSNAYYVVRINNNYSGSVNQNDTLTIERRFTVTNRNVAYFTKSSWEATSARVGTSATGGSVTFIANSLVNNVTSASYGGVEYYEVQFNNSFSGTLSAGTGTVEFTFVQPPFAQPGETVFSFIAVPGERSTLDLSNLKELTNTPLGGRGTFPNGPDVLAINVYKVSGDGIVSNLIIRWGEAQA
jgi:plastocyanin